MKSRQIFIVAACLVALVVSGWIIAGCFWPQPSAGSNPKEAVKPVPALGLGNEQDRRWIEYYYRHRALNDAVGVALRIAETTRDDDDSRPTSHFFATILRGEPARIAQIESEAEKAKGAARVFLQLVAADAATEGVTRIKDKKDLHLAWAEYLATGDVGRIDTILSVFDEPESNHTAMLQSDAHQFLLNVAPFHADVYSAVLLAARLADGSRLDKVQYLADELRARLDGPVADRLTRAINLANQRDYKEARKLIAAALLIFPDSARSQSALADVAEEEGKLEEARVAVRRAIAVYPDDSKYYYNLGRLSCLLRDYKAAIGSYEKAVELGYSDAAVWHGMARAYQESGNHKEAVQFFKKYLQLEPHGPQESLVKAYLTSVNQPAEEDPKDLISMLVRADYAALEERLTTILREKKRNEDGRSELYAAYHYLCTHLDGRYGYEKFMAHFERWASERPKSHFAHAAYGSVLIDYAWQARGSGWSNTVTSKGESLFEERLQKARAELERAYELKPSDPMPPAYLLTVVKGLGLDRAEMEKQFQRGITASPHEYALYRNKLEYLFPKWYGTEEEVFAFARETAKNAPADSLLPMILVEAHWELFDRNNLDRRYFQQPGVWEEMKPAYIKVCNKFPNAKGWRDWFALNAFYAGDYETAERQLQIIGNNWMPSVWDNKKFLDRVRAETRRKLGR